MDKKGIGSNNVYKETLTVHRTLVLVTSRKIRSRRFFAKLVRTVLHFIRLVRFMTHRLTAPSKNRFSYCPVLYAPFTAEPCTELEYLMLV